MYIVCSIGSRVTKSQDYIEPELWGYVLLLIELPIMSYYYELFSGPKKHSGGGSLHIYGGTGTKKTLRLRGLPLENSSVLTHLLFWIYEQVCYFSWFFFPLLSCLLSLEFLWDPYWNFRGPHLPTSTHQWQWKTVLPWCNCQFGDYFAKQMNLQEIFCTRTIRYLKASTDVKISFFFNKNGAVVCRSQNGPLPAIK